MHGKVTNGHHTYGDFEEQVRSHEHGIHDNYVRYEKLRANEGQVLPAVGQDDLVLGLLDVKVCQLSGACIGI